MIGELCSGSHRQTPAVQPFKTKSIQIVHHMAMATDPVNQQNIVWSPAQFCKSVFKRDENAKVSATAAPSYVLFCSKIVHTLITTNNYELQISHFFNYFFRVEWSTIVFQELIFYFVANFFPY